jgi:hypothetical protein
MVGLFQEGILQPSNLIGALELIGAVVRHCLPRRTPCKHCL